MILESLRNCRASALGRKLRRVYLAVKTLLSTYEVRLLLPRITTRLSFEDEFYDSINLLFKFYKSDHQYSARHFIKQTAALELL